MKKFNLITFAVILMLLPILQSCLDDANNDEWSLVLRVEYWPSAQ